MKLKNGTKLEASSTRAAPLSPKVILWFWSLLLLTAGVCLVWSHFRLFWADELLEYYTDSRPTIDIVRGQLHAPFSLEPPSFHLLLHLLHRSLPSPVLAARLPSILSLLVTEVSAFFIALHLSGEEGTAAAAMLLPFILVTIDYGPEARVYSVLTASLALSLLCWFHITIDGGRRRLALVGLTLSLATGVLSHYYGILLTVPLWGGEIVRSAQRRRVDLRVLLALLLGTGSVLMNLPFQRALAPFRLHYYDTGETKWTMISFTYAWFVNHFAVYAMQPRHLRITERIWLLFILVLAAKVLLRIVDSWGQSSSWIEAALLITMLLPFLNLAVAQFTRAYVPRYSLPAIVGVAVLVPLVLFEFQFFRRGRELLLVLISLAAVSYVYDQFRLSQNAGRLILAGLQPKPELAESLRAQPDQHIYVQNVARLLVNHFYAPDVLKPVIVGFYSAPCELKWRHRDPASLFAQSMSQTANLPFIPFSKLYASGSPRLLVVYHDSTEEWVEQELQAQGAEVKAMGKALGGDLLQVNFSKTPSCETSPADKKSGDAASIR